MNQRVSLCIIARNEEKNLAACLQSLADLVTEIIVVDTGSTDQTREIARGFGARVYEFPWIDDFAAARNESCRHASGDWILWMDADDQLDHANRRRLGQLFQSLETIDADSHPVFCMECVCDQSDDVGLSLNHGRLFRNDKALRWTGRIHERLTPAAAGVRLCLVPTDVEIIHHGYVDAAQMALKHQRNARLLEQEYLLHPDDAVILFYMARDRLRVQDYAAAMSFARRSIAGDPAGTLATTQQSFAVITECFLKLGRPADSLDSTAQGLLRFHDDPELLCQRALALHALKRLEDARKCVLSLLSMNPAKPLLGVSRRDCHRARAHEILGGIYQDQGDLRAAEAAFKSAVDLQPDCSRAYLSLGMVQLQMGQIDEVRALMERLTTLAHAKYELAMLRGLVCTITMQLGEAQRHLAEAMAHRPDKAYPWVVLSTVLFQEGRDWPRCIEVHEKALAMDPNVSEVRARLQRMRAVSHARSARASIPHGAEVHPGVHAGIQGNVVCLPDAGNGGAFAF